MRNLCRHADRLRPGKGRLRDCLHPLVGGEVESGKQCQTCEKWVAREARAPAPGAGRTELPLAPPPQPKPPPTPVADVCRHRSAEPSGSAPCATCAGRVELKLYDCAIHGTCTIVTKVEARGCCKGCTERAAG